MTGTSDDDLRRQARDAAAGMRALLDQLADGWITATEVEQAYLRGAADTADRLAGPPS